MSRNTAICNAFVIAMQVSAGFGRDRPNRIESIAILHSPIRYDKNKRHRRDRKKVRYLRLHLVAKIRREHNERVGLCQHSSDFISVLTIPDVERETLVGITPSGTDHPASESSVEGGRQQG